MPRVSWRNEVIDLRVGAGNEELPEVLLQPRVGRGPSLVLTHVLVPARHDEGFDEPLRPVGVAV